MYSDPDVLLFVTERFEPVRVHVREQADAFKALGERYNAHWTPTVLLLDPAGTARHRMEGFLPTRDFMSQLELGLAKSACTRGQYAAARELFDLVIARYPESDAAPEAQYWSGVSQYKETGDAGALGALGRRFQERYADTVWARKASVFRG